MIRYYGVNAYQEHYIPKILEELCMMWDLRTAELLNKAMLLLKMWKYKKD